ncbi:MAG: L-erythro-3,5-diaminohexanoate dehydrogenase [Pseudonocardiaceae bacterium]|nr:L-erythro-3,5-diaminohexanoate dehydrogenase [Pseudonocardiaceae bacterium]
MSSPYGLHRVVEPAGVLPQQAWRLSTEPQSWPDEVLIDVERLNLDAASYRQLREQHCSPAAVRDAVLEIVATRGKMHNPVTGSGGMLLGTVREVGPESPLGLNTGDRIATLVSLTLTPLRIDDGLADWSGEREQVPCRGTAVLFGRSIAAVLPPDLPDELALSVLDVCGAPALTDRVVREAGNQSSVLVLGGGGKSGSLSLAVLATADGGTIVFFSMATSFSAAALGAEGLAADVRMLIGNGFVPGHAQFALELFRATPGVRELFERRERHTSPT